ncbi:MAG TPA: arginine--tRNA ligase [Myxococcaceae bacterium]|nr:arginine--tRNA ligase [Myxococcaceae bacterium]
MHTPVYDRYRRAFAEGLAAALNMSFEEVEPQVKPAEAAHGDLSFATFPLAKAQRKAPPAIASAIASQLQVQGLVVSAVGPYVNARFAAAPFTAEVLGTVKEQGAAYGQSTAGEGRTVLVEYSSPNIAKPIGFHHIRTTMIGHAVANLYRSQGYKVVSLNYLGDWGKQFGLVAVGFKEYGDPARRDDVTHLVEVYVKANARAEQDPVFDAEARAFFRKMEDGDAEALALWKGFRDASLENFKKVYRRLGIHYDSYEGESDYRGARMDAVVDEVTRTVGTRISEGALIVDVPYADNEPPVLLRKSDGTTLYVTRDLAAAEDRYARYHFHRSLYVVAQDQALHLRQVFGVLGRMSKAWAQDCVHVSFGRVHGMSTRKGKVVMLEDVLDEAKSRALEKVSENQKVGRIQTDDAEALAEQIGLGALVFGDLKNRRATDYTFDWDEVLNFDGHTGPYLQYAHARACNLLKRGGGAPEQFDPALLALPEEQALVRVVATFPKTVREAREQHEPSLVSRHLLELAAAFSRWYTLGNQDREKRVLVEGDDPTRAARLVLADAVRVTLSAGLELLGITAPQSM